MYVFLLHSDGLDGGGEACAASMIHRSYAGWSSAPGRFNHAGQVLWGGSRLTVSWGSDWHSVPCKKILTAKCNNRSKNQAKKNSLRGNDSASAAARRTRRAAVDASMKTSGQTRTSERRRRKRRSGTGCQMRSLHLSSVGAEASSRSLPCGSRVNLRRTIRVGAWNVRTLRHDHSICQLSDELRRLRVSVAALSEVRRPGSGVISVGGYTYYWSGQDSGRHFSGVAIAVADWLIPAVDKICRISDRVMSLRLRHSLGVLAVFSVYAPTSKGSDDNKNLFYQQLSAAVEQCTARETPLVMGNFNVVVGYRHDA